MSLKAKKISLFLILMSAAAFITISLAQQNDYFKYESKGNRDPFVPLVGSGKDISTNADEIISVDDIVLEGIAVGAKGKRSAIMNGQLLKEGDTLGSFKIVGITDKSVTVSMDGEKYNVTLPEEGGEKSEK